MASKWSNYVHKEGDDQQDDRSGHFRVPDGWKNQVSNLMNNK